MMSCTPQQGAQRCQRMSVAPTRSSSSWLSVWHTAWCVCLLLPHRCSCCQHTTHARTAAACLLLAGPAGWLARTKLLWQGAGAADADPLVAPAAVFFLLSVLGAGLLCCGPDAQAAAGCQCRQHTDQGWALRVLTCGWEAASVHTLLSRMCADRVQHVGVCFDLWGSKGMCVPGAFSAHCGCAWPVSSSACVMARTLGCWRDCCLFCTGVSAAVVCAACVERVVQYSFIPSCTVFCCVPAWQKMGGVSLGLQDEEQHPEGMRACEGDSVVCTNSCK